MFEVGWSEYLLIFGLALVVLGPEKLPKVAASIGRWVGRARVMARQFRDQLESEAETIRSSVDDVKKDFQSAASDMQSGLSDADLGLQPNPPPAATTTEEPAATGSPGSPVTEDGPAAEIEGASQARAIPAAAIGSAAVGGAQVAADPGVTIGEHETEPAPQFPPFSEVPPRAGAASPATSEGQDERR